MGTDGGFRWNGGGSVDGVVRSSRSGVGDPVNVLERRTRHFGSPKVASEG